MTRTIPEISAEVEILHRMISKMDREQPELLYEAMTTAIGQDIKDVRHLLASARRKSAREDGIVTVAVRGVGIRRAFDGDFIDIAEADTRKLMRAAGRGLKTSLKMSKEEYEALPQEERTRLNVKRTQLGLVRSVTGAQAHRKLIESPQVNNNRLPEAEAYGQLFKK